MEFKDVVVRLGKEYPSLNHTLEYDREEYEDFIINEISYRRRVYGLIGNYQVMIQLGPKSWHIAGYATNKPSPNVFSMQGELHPIYKLVEVKFLLDLCRITIDTVLSVDRLTES